VCALLLSQVYQIVKRELDVLGFIGQNYCCHKLPPEATYPAITYSDLNTSTGLGFGLDFNDTLIRFSFYSTLSSPSDLYPMVKTLEEHFNRNHFAPIDTDYGIGLVCCYKVADELKPVTGNQFRWIYTQDYKFVMYKDAGEP
jgi:hypothetical protein